MRRFTTNKWWIFILALVLGAAALSGSVRSARADESLPFDGGGGSPPPPPVGAGDPDIPTAPGRGLHRGGIIQRGNGPARLSTGDRGVSGYQGIQWQLRIRVVVQQVFRTYFVRF